MINIFAIVFLPIRNIIFATVELADFPLVRNRKILHLIEMGIAFARYFSLRVIRDLWLISVIIHVEFFHNYMVLVFLRAHDFYLIKFSGVLRQTFTIGIIPRPLYFSVQILSIQIKILNGILDYRACVEL